MKDNSPAEDGWRGSIVLVSSTSGYFGGTEVVSYVSSKHGIIGLLRSSCAKTKRMGIRLNGVAPFITPTYITSGYSDLWNDRGLPINTPDQVALGILQMSLDPNMQGGCSLVRSLAGN
jgi:NAD(P)-dependent dehydrogenase (short-subunit alcohol dehydrogenase family)